MTFKKLWKFVTTKLIWLTCWNGKSEPSKDVKKITTTPLLIPKPKFKVGDVVKVSYSPRRIRLVSALYDYESKTWVYENIFNTFFNEDELELVESVKGESNV